MEIGLDFRAADPTQRKQLQSEQLLACYQHALGHDLPNQLVALQGLARILEMELADEIPAESRDHLLRLAALARRTDEFIRKLAQVGRTCRDAGPPTRVAFADVAREALAEANLLSPNGRLEYHGGEDQPFLAVSRAAVHQVLLQLLRNSIAAVAPERVLHAVVSARGVANGVEISVRDNGVGIPDEILTRLFDSRAEGSACGAAGLGLFLVRQLIAGWGGTLQIQSEAGRGTTVTFFVPSD